MLILTRADVTALLDLKDCIEAVEQAFIQHAKGELPTAPGILGAHVAGGGFHIKTAALGKYFAAKVNANYPDNPRLRSLPTVQGVITLFDLPSGKPLAVLDSIEITIQRTAAASAVAARALARSDAHTVTVYGCGVQGKATCVHSFSFGRLPTPMQSISIRHGPTRSLKNSAPNWT